MAKMFYTTEEAAAKLGVSPDQLKQMVTENKLREFRDGVRVMFKVDQVDRLAGDAKAKSSASGTAIGLSDSGIQLAPTESSAGKHDAISLADSEAGRGAPAKEETAASASGKQMFDTGELKPADSAAQTHIQPAVEDQLSLEGVGSGSGLLDLTRESDDTSLGAELLDEIYPGESKAGATPQSASGIFEQPSAGETASGPSGLEHMTTAPAPVAAAPEIVEAADASASAFGGIALASILTMLATFIALGAAFYGITPSWVSTITAETVNLIIFGVILVVLTLLFAGVGFFVGKATVR